MTGGVGNSCHEDLPPATSPLLILTSLLFVPFSCILRRVTCDRTQATEIGRQAATFLHTRQHCCYTGPKLRRLLAETFCNQEEEGVKTPTCVPCTDDPHHFFTDFTITTRSVLHKVGLTWDRKNGLLPGAVARGNNTLEEKQKRGRFPVVAKSCPPGCPETTPTTPLLGRSSSSWSCGLPQTGHSENPPPPMPDLHADVTRE